ncbi:MAG: DNA repair protein RecO [Candidatus Liberibacter europaeus]|uniref:DNA repair protein RecO n=1 Tax=Candidatus Liberibacter europaeus TaxID=744859 RepID=A0A2T4VWF8_9HYPH|nr:DNA repair protein RecO [Candidatus Liberibacter europaeus]PTL86124.1 MAG: DNA repair protein RecO [Candidatus Liberibacter europaeus]
MQWQDDAIILGMRAYGEKNIILEVITRNYGRHLGFVRNGQSPRMKSILQAGNLVMINWRSRLSQDLGEFRLEIIEQRFTSFLYSSIFLYGIQSIIILIKLLPERDPCPELYELVNVFFDSFNVSSSVLGKLFVQIELILLKNLGFGLDLTKCVITGDNYDLCWVSPKSGCAVCRSIGEPYANKMLILPQFLCEKDQIIDIDSLKQAFQLTGYFIGKYAYTHNIVNNSDFRTNFLNKLLESM